MVWYGMAWYGRIWYLDVVKYDMLTRLILYIGVWLGGNASVEKLFTFCTQQLLFRAL